MRSDGAPDQLDDSDCVCAEHVGDDDYLVQLVNRWVQDDPEAGGCCAFCLGLGMPVRELVEAIADGVYKFYEDAEGKMASADDDFLTETSDIEEVLADLGIDDSSPLQLASRNHIGEDRRWVDFDCEWPSRYSLMQNAWEAFTDHVMHRSRFLFEMLKTRDDYGGVDPFDCWSEQSVVGRVADVHAVIDDDPVDVVHHLGLVAELDWFAETSFADRSGVGFVQ